MTDSKCLVTLQKALDNHPLPPDFNDPTFVYAEHKNRDVLVSEYGYAIKAWFEGFEKLFSAFQKLSLAKERSLRNIVEDMKHIPSRRLPLGKNAWVSEWSEVIAKLEQVFDENFAEDKTFVHVDRKQLSDLLQTMPNPKDAAYFAYNGLFRKFDFDPDLKTWKMKLEELLESSEQFPTKEVS
jgi:hypothetical protein